MSNPSSERAGDVLHPRVTTMEQDAALRAGAPAGPRVIATGETGRIVTAPPQPATALAVPGRVRRRSRTMRFALTALGAGVAGWLGIDLYLWITSAFAYGGGLGWLASAAAAAAIGGAGLIIAREVRSFLALKSVETCQQRFAALAPPPDTRSAAMHDAIRKVIAVIPRDRATTAAIEAFQRKVQRHHSPAQQLEIFAQTVMEPLDRRAEAIVRRAGVRAFGITAISPTALTDALFFLAASIRLVRDVAACYGHRPNAAATVHLLRRLVVEAGKLGAVDLAGAAIATHLGGAVAERLAASTAGSVYAAQRMSRLGLATMSLCRPVPFREHELPSLWSAMLGALLARPEPDQRPPAVSDQTKR